MPVPIAPAGGAPVVNEQVASNRPKADGFGERGRVAEEVDSREVVAAIGESAKQVVSGGRTLEVSFDDSINRVVIKVKSGADGEIVRQIPPEDYMKFLAKFNESIGVLFDETA